MSRSELNQDIQHGQGLKCGSKKVFIEREEEEGRRYMVQKEYGLLQSENKQRNINIKNKQARQEKHVQGRIGLESKNQGSSFNQN